jgi:hypothetical protein
MHWCGCMQDFSGFRVVALLPRWWAMWPPPLIDNTNFQETKVPPPLPHAAHAEGSFSCAGPCCTCSPATHTSPCHILGACVILQGMHAHAHTLRHPKIGPGLSLSPLPPGTTPSSILTSCNACPSPPPCRTSSTLDLAPTSRRSLGCWCGNRSCFFFFNRSSHTTRCALVCVTCLWSGRPCACIPALQRAPAARLRRRSPVSARACEGTYLCALMRCCRCSTSLSARARFGWGRGGWKSRFMRRTRTNEIEVRVSTCLRVRVCVCERGRERKSESEAGGERESGCSRAMRVRRGH